MLKGAYEKAVGQHEGSGRPHPEVEQEALGLLNKRFTEAMDEVKTLVVKKG